MTESYTKGTPMSAKLIQKNLMIYLEKVGHRCDIRVECRDRPIERSTRAVGTTWRFMVNIAIDDTLWVVVKIGNLRCRARGRMIIESVGSFLRKELETRQGVSEKNTVAAVGSTQLSA